MHLGVFGSNGGMRDFWRTPDTLHFDDHIVEKRAWEVGGVGSFRGASSLSPLVSGAVHDLLILFLFYERRSLRAC